jgi:hypothetical protein
LQSLPQVALATRRRRRLRLARTLVGHWVRTHLPPAGERRRLGDLAVSTVFRGNADGGDVVCPVTVRYRVEGGAGYLPAHEVPERTAAVVAMRGLVVELHCLPAHRAVVPA